MCDADGWPPRVGLGTSGRWIGSICWKRTVIRSFFSTVHGTMGKYVCCQWVGGDQEDESRLTFFDN